VRETPGKPTGPISRDVTASALDPGHPEVNRVLDLIDRVMVGKRPVAERLLCALIAGGHVLIEDVPGVGKTLLAKTLAWAVSLTFSRVQFTPDLLPTDLLGATVWDPASRTFSFRPGPVFTQLLLADEINRTSPRTQAALLEVMEENQVTVDGHTYPLDPPFMVVATENPIEYEGTYPLPEAQLDRFLFHLAMGYPTPAEERTLLARMAGTNPLDIVGPVMSRDAVMELRAAARSITAAPPVLAYVAELAKRTREHPQLYLGASPRAAIALLHAGQAWALMHGRSYVIPDDIRALAVDTWVHRLIPRQGASRLSVAAHVLQEIITDTPIPQGDAS
jgi:MoxR-like ATPase